MLNVECNASNDQQIFFGNPKLEGHEGSIWRTIGYEEQNDPKKIFFLRMDLNQNNPSDLENSSPGDPEMHLNEERSKRQADEQVLGMVEMKTDTDEEPSTQKQELDTLDTLQVFTETAPTTTEIGAQENNSKNNFIPINDFIRFRRQLKHGGDNGSNSMGKVQNFDLEKENADSQNNRGARGLTKQEWVKFPYQIQRTLTSDDSIASSSDFSKPRRVHFITQKQFEVENPLASSNQRQGRVSDTSRPSRNQPRDPRVEMDQRKGQDLFTPRLRDFDGPPDYPYFQNSRGRYYERDLIENRRPGSRSLEIYPRYRDRRIIYYANLPEITRNSPRLRETERYRDPFYDEYSGHLYQRAFYRNNRNEEILPMKVSADINVREVKKNPEKRIYSDVQRKYPYDLPPFDANQPTRH
ncbi:uncharacterized protein LOC123686056 isoform X2 [Harmonia axyridis]|nr:uncharacterized protein LOC123686056 isoform X2 [Harmonia axyridis]